MRYYVLSLLFIILRIATSKSVNSGCFTGNKKIDVFCEYTGCYNQQNNGKYDEPIIVKYMKGSKIENINFVCSSKVESDSGIISNYNIVSSSEDNDFIIPITMSNEAQYWFSPPIKSSKLGLLELEFNNLEALDNKDYILILREDRSVYCKIDTSDIIDEAYNVVVGKSDETYIIRVDLHVNSTNDSYIRCPTQGYPLNDEIQYENINNYRLLNTSFSLRRIARHILVYEDTLHIRVSGLI